MTGTHTLSHPHARTNLEPGAQVLLQRELASLDRFEGGAAIDLFQHQRADYLLLRFEGLGAKLAHKSVFDVLVSDTVFRAVRKDGAQAVHKAGADGRERGRQGSARQKHNEDNT